MGGPDFPHGYDVAFAKLLWPLVLDDAQTSPRASVTMMSTDDIRMSNQSTLLSSERRILNVPSTSSTSAHHREVPYW